jgi:succinyl-CoA synthetase beta subunit
MKIHEYQAKQLFAAAGVPVPTGIVAKSAEDAAQAYTKIGTPVAVVKSQIHAGGRGKGRFKEHPQQPGVVLVKSADEAKQHAQRMLGSTLVTIQTGPDGKKVQTLFVEQGLAIAQELYLAVVVDREVGLPVIIASSEGGMAIEEIAHDHPEKIIREHFDPAVGLQPYQARKVAYALGLDATAVRSAESFLPKVCKFFVDGFQHDEINPLVVTKEGQLLA